MKVSLFPLTNFPLHLKIDRQIQPSIARQCSGLSCPLSPQSTPVHPGPRLARRSFAWLLRWGAPVCGLQGSGVKRFRFVGVTLPRDCAPEAHFGAAFFPLNLECIAVACNSSFPLPASSGLLPSRPSHALRTCYVCLLFDFYPLNLERIAVACSSGFPLSASSRLLPARPTHALRYSRSFKALVVRAPFAVWRNHVHNVCGWR